MPVTYDEARTNLDRQMEALNLASLHKAVLRALALDDRGFQSSAAPGIIAYSINRSPDDCSQALTELTGLGLVLTVPVDSVTRLVANYGKLGLSEEERQALHHGHPAPFKVLDAPHSAEAMATLHALFLQEEQPIFVALDVTSHRVFEKLSDRAAAGKMTTFISPHRHVIPIEKRAYHKEVLAGWVRFVRDLPESSRRNVRLLVTRRTYRYLHTSTLTATAIRFNCYWYARGTTRAGTMVWSERGSSLYDLVHREYASAVDDAFPVFRLAPAEWFRKLATRFAPVATTAVLLVAAYLVDQAWGATFKPAAYLAVFLTGLAGEAAWEFHRSTIRIPPELYES